jgi:hypothetical protein
MGKDLGWLIIVLIIGFGIGRYTAPDPNAIPTYGKTGLPKNCRAVIQTNLDAWEAKQYSADAIFSSIARNCGVTGQSWEQ